MKGFGKLGSFAFHSDFFPPIFRSFSGLFLVFNKLTGSGWFMEQSSALNGKNRKDKPFSAEFSVVQLSCEYNSGGLVVFLPSEPLGNNKKDEFGCCFLMESMLSLAEETELGDNKELQLGP